MSTAPLTPRAVDVADVPLRQRKSVYPPEFARRMAGRDKQVLGDLFKLTQFGVNLTTLAPGAVSALQHGHSRQDEFIYLLEGELVLVAGDEEIPLRAGMCAGFPAGGTTHHLENRGKQPARYLEIGDRTEGDAVHYPADDLKAVRVDGAWRFLHKDGNPYA